VPLDKVPDDAIKKAGLAFASGAEEFTSRPFVPKVKSRPSVFSLSDRVALVTGASRGLGAEMALGLARAGALVLINGRTEDNLQATATRIAAIGGRCAPLAFDVGDGAAIAAAFETIARDHGRLDVLVSNVGTRKRGALDDLSRDDLTQMLATNLTASSTWASAPQP